MKYLAGISHFETISDFPSLKHFPSFLGSCFRLCERNVSSSLRLTRNTDLKSMYGFCTKPQETSKAPSCKFLLVFPGRARELPKSELGIKGT